MKSLRWLVALVATALFGTTASAANKHLLLITDSGGYIHDSVGLAEQILKEIGPKNGFDVTCYRYTRDPKSPDFAKYAEEFRKRTGVPVEPENCGRVNAETLKKFDCVLFFTTGNPISAKELKELSKWVKDGHAVAGVHCGADTMYSEKRPGNALYGELIGAYFDGHPWHKKIKVVVEDPNHPAGHGFKTGDTVTDEIYQFRPQPYSRDKLHIIMHVDNSSIDTSKGKRQDKDYAISWCHDVGKGRAFYTSLGHEKAVWRDPRYQQHLVGGLRWAMKLEDGDATPSAKLSK